jgi:tyrosine decarboxylase/aspartate 1-decarboxylase
MVTKAKSFLCFAAWGYDMNTKIVEKNYDMILQELNQYKTQDFTFASRHILGSMCTQPHPIAKKAYMKFLETNLGDPELFPGTKKIEEKFISFLSTLVHAPNTATGQIVGGGTEGNITAMWLTKALTGKKEIIIPDSAHFSFQKIASLMDVKLIAIPLTKDYVMDITKIKEKISAQTAAVVGIAGSTELGAIDPIPELSDLCRDEQLFLHVDAAFGGFVIPFLKMLHYDVPDFDFQLKGVSTISIDAHKMGCAAIPLGTLIVREKKWLDAISVESNCISSDRQTGVLGTRSGGPVAAAYAVAKYLGKEGYKDMIQKCMKTTYYAEQRIRELGLRLVTKPTMNVLGLQVKHPSKLVRKLTTYGWKVNNMKRISCIRIVLMPHVTKEIIDEFIPDLKKACMEIGEL